MTYEELSRRLGVCFINEQAIIGQAEQDRERCLAGATSMLQEMRCIAQYQEMLKLARRSLRYCVASVLMEYFQQPIISAKRPDGNGDDIEMLVFPEHVDFTIAKSRFDDGAIAQNAAYKLAGCGCGGGAAKSSAGAPPDISELERRLEACEVEYRARRRAAFDQFSTCSTSDNPYSDPQQQHAFCQGQLLGALGIIEEDRKQCIFKVVTEFLNPTPGSV